MTRWAWVAAPCVAALAAAAAIGLLGDDPVVYLSGPLGWLLVGAGVIVTLAAAAVLGRSRPARPRAPARHRGRRRGGGRRPPAAADAARPRAQEPAHRDPRRTGEPREGSEPAARERALDGVGAQASRLSRLMTDLRKLTELETRELERAPVDLGDCCARSTRRCASSRAPASAGCG